MRDLYTKISALKLQTDGGDRCDRQTDRRMGALVHNMADAVDGVFVVVARGGVCIF